MAITINGTGSITGLTAGGLPDGSVVADDLASSLDLTGKTVTLPSGTGGKILQVVTTQYSTATTVSITGGSHADVGFSVDITPTTSNSVMLVAYSLMGETGDNPWDAMASFSRTISGTRTVVLPTGYGSRNPGIIAMGESHGSTDNSSTPGIFTMPLFPDTGRPANTNTITYAPTVMHAGNMIFGINRTITDSDSTSYERGISWITVMEVAA
jgi:hypothetical protein